MRELAEENIGSMMIFQMCDLLKEKITEINDKVLEKLDEIEQKESMQHALGESTTTDQTNLNFTPVNAETFAAWCDTYMKRIIAERIAKFGLIDDKPTGKQLFMMNKNAFEDLTLEEEVGEDDEEFKGDEEEKKEDSEDDVEFKYDRALYDPDALNDEEEEPDFDDDDN